MINSEILKEGIKRIANRLGLEVRRLPKQSLLYTRTIPEATYSPWNGDVIFQGTYEDIKAHTLVDRYRCYELWSLTEQSKKIEGSILEVGVWRGGTGALIAKKAELCGISTPVYLCDTFAGVPKAGPEDSLYRGGEYADTSRAAVERLVYKHLRLTNVRILEGVFPEDTSHHIEQETFRFCHIDVDIYQSAKATTEWVWDRLSIGGIIVYDDYGFIGADGVTQYVNEQRPEKDRLVIHNLNGHAIVVRIK